MIDNLPLAVAAMVSQGALGVVGTVIMLMLRGQLKRMDRLETRQDQVDKNIREQLEHLHKCVEQRLDETNERMGASAQQRTDLVIGQAKLAAQLQQLDVVQERRHAENLSSIAGINQKVSAMMQDELRSLRDQLRAATLGGQK